MNVARRAGDDPIDAALGDARAVALVVPERLRVDAIKAQRRGEEEDSN